MFCAGPNIRIEKLIKVFPNPSAQRDCPGFN